VFFDEPKVIQVHGRQAVAYSPIGHYCESCGTEIHVGVEHLTTSSKPKILDKNRTPIRHVVCKCRWQRVHIRDLPKSARQWISFWRPWSPAMAA
jgi:hypothetical protein